MLTKVVSAQEFGLDGRMRHSAKDHRIAWDVRSPWCSSVILSECCSRDVAESIERCTAHLYTIRHATRCFGALSGEIDASSYAVLSVLFLRAQLS